MNLHILTRDVGQQNEYDGTDVNLAFQGLLHEVLLIIKQKIMTVSIETNIYQRKSYTSMKAYHAGHDVHEGLDHAAHLTSDARGIQDSEQTAEGCKKDTKMSKFQTQALQNSLELRVTYL